MHHLLASAACSLGLLSLLACAPDGPEEVEPPIDLIAHMQIGGGAEGSGGFATVEDGSDVLLARGAQGGFHVWTAPRFRGAMGTLYLDRTARRVEGDALVLRAARLVLHQPRHLGLDGR